MKNKIFFLLVLVLFLNLVNVNFISGFNFVGNGGTTIHQNITVNGTHNQLAGLQGGSTAEYFHLNQTVYNYVVANYSSWITSAGTDSFIANFTNFSRMYANITLYNTSWSNTTNLTYFIGYNYAVNSTGSGTDTFAANFTNFTNIYANITDYNASWTDRTNLTYFIGYTYATNGTYLTSFTELDPKWTANWTNFTVVYGYALNSSNTFTGNYSNFTNIYSNITLYNDSWTNRTNLSYYLTTNPFGFYNLTTAPIYLNDTFATNYTNFTVIFGYAINTTDTDTFVANYSTYLTKPTWTQVLNGSLIGSNNVTYAYSLNDTLWTANYSNFSIGWLYAVNSTGSSDSFIANYTNFTRIYANVTDYNSSWSSTTNTSYLLGTNVTYAYALNDSLWTANYTNFTIIYGYAINTSDTDTFIANYSDYLTTKNHALNWTNNWSNFTRLYANVTLYNTSWSTDTDTDSFIANYTNFSVIYGYAINTTDTDSFIANYSTYLTKPTWTQVLNGSLIASNNVTYAYSLNDTQWTNNWSNFTTIYANQVGNASGAFIANTNVTYAYALNDTLWTANYSTYLTKPTWTQVLNGSLIGSGNVTYAYSLNDSLWSTNYSNFSIGWLYAINSTGGTDSFIANYSNFTVIYGYAINTSDTDSFIANFTNFTTMYANQVGNASGNFISNSNVTYAYSLNNTLWTLNYSTFLTHITWANAVNGTLRPTTNLSFYGGNVSINLTSTNNALNVRGGINLTNNSLSSVFFLNETSANLTIGTASNNVSMWMNGTGFCIAGC